MKQKIFCIVPAAGVGARFGSATPKLLFPIHNRPAIEWTAKSLIKAKVFEKIIFVIPCGSHDFNFLKELSPSIELVSGGAERSESVFKGFISCESSDRDIILIHDGARPAVSKEAIELVIDETKEYGAVTLGTKISDTVKRVVGNEVIETLNRNELVTVQTPQGFTSKILNEAFKSNDSGFHHTDEASLVEQMHKVKIVFSNTPNPKLTTVEDLWMLEKLLKI